MHNEYLEILGLKPGASVADIKKAYRVRAKQFHPDLNKSETAREAFIRITEAYRFLLDVGPRPNQEDIRFNYNPHETEYEEWRRKAREYARKKAREKAREQQLLLSNIYKVFNYVGVVILVFNGVLITDFLLPAKARQEKVMAVTQVYEKRGRSQVRIYDQIYFESFSFRVKEDLAVGIKDQAAVIYTTPVTGFIKNAAVSLPTGVKRLKPAYGIYNIFKLLVPVAILFSIVYFFLPYHHINKITIVVFLSLILFFQLLLVLNFSY